MGFIHAKYQTDEMWIKFIHPTEFHYLLLSSTFLLQLQCHSLPTKDMLSCNTAHKYPLVGQAHPGKMEEHDIETTTMHNVTMIVISITGGEEVSLYRMFYNFSRGNLRQPSNYLSQNQGSEVGTVPTKLLRSSSAENGNLKEKTTRVMLLEKYLVSPNKLIKV